MFEFVVGLVVGAAVVAAIKYMREKRLQSNRVCTAREVQTLATEANMLRDALSILLRKLREKTGASNNVDALRLISK